MHVIFCTREYQAEQADEEKTLIQHHCGEITYLNDVHCPSCGETLQHDRTLNSAENLMPEAIDALRQACPKAKVFTGEVISTYHYKRVYITANYSYWFVTLVDSEGQELSINVPAEGKDFDKIAVGDVLTVLNPADLVLRYRLLDKHDAKHITSNAYAVGVVYHRETQQLGYFDPEYQPPKPNYIVEGILTAIITVLLIFAAVELDVISSYEVLENGFAVSIVAFGVIHCWKKWVSKKTAKQIEIAKDWIKKCTNISKYDLGYVQLRRPTQRDDVNCAQCNKRLSSHVPFCPHCGQHQVMQATDIQQGQAMTTADDTAVVKGDTRVTSESMRMAEMAKWDHRVDGKFRNHSALLFHSTYQGAITGELVRVCDREVESKVKSHTTYDLKTTTHYDRYGNVDYQTEKRVNEQLHRTSDIKGQLSVEDSKGDRYTVTLPQSALGTADKGDYLLLTTVTLQRKGRRAVNNIEACYNLSKDRLSHGTRLQQYFSVSPVLHILTIVAAVFLVPAGIWLGREFLDQTLIAGASLAGVYALILFAKGRNKFSAYRMRKPMTRHISQMKKQRDAILASLSQFH